MEQRIQPPRFLQAIRHYMDEISIATMYRYARGDLPPFAILLLKNPELARALADDAQDLARQRGKLGSDESPK